MKVCTRCKIEDGAFATIHEHHKNGIHEDNRPENKMDLCANCHMTLHWKRWKLSDIGMEDVEMQRKSRTEMIMEAEFPTRNQLLNDLERVNLELEILKLEVEKSRMRVDKIEMHTLSMFVHIIYMVRYYNHALEKTVTNYIDTYRDADTLPTDTEIRKMLQSAP